MKELQRKREALDYKIALVPEYGEVAAGSVVAFVPRNDFVPVALPAHISPPDVGVVTISGCSLEDYGVYDGDRLIFTKVFTKRDAMRSDAMEKLAAALY